MREMSDVGAAVGNVLESFCVLMFQTPDRGADINAHARDKQSRAQSNLKCSHTSNTPVFFLWCRIHEANLAVLRYSYRLLLGPSEKMRRMTSGYTANQRRKYEESAARNLCRFNI